MTRKSEQIPRAGRRGGANTKGWAERVVATRRARVVARQEGGLSTRAYQELEGHVLLWRSAESRRVAVSASHNLKSADRGVAWRRPRLIADFPRSVVPTTATLRGHINVVRANLESCACRFRFDLATASLIALSVQSTRGSQRVVGQLPRPGSDSALCLGPPPC